MAVTTVPHQTTNQVRVTDAAERDELWVDTYHDSTASNGDAVAVVWVWSPEAQPSQNREGCGIALKAEDVTAIVNHLVPGLADAREAISAARDLIEQCGGADPEDRQWLDQAADLLSTAFTYVAP